MQQEVLEAQGHLIDSHLMERIFDTVVEYSGNFHVEEFRIGQTNAEPSYLRMRVETAENVHRSDAAESPSGSTTRCLPFGSIFTSATSLR